MPTATLVKMDKILADIMAKPLSGTLEELRAVAQADPQNPAPHLAMAIVDGFYGVSHRDFERTRDHLEKAKELLGAAGGDHTETEFSKNLFTVLDGNLRMRELQQRPGGTLAPETADLYKAAIASQKALGQMGRATRRLRELGLPRAIYAALRVLSMTNPARSAEYRRGMSMLSQMFREDDGTANLAGFFLLYGYRKSRNYRQAIRVGNALEERFPLSVMLKKAVGSAYHFSGRFKEAEDYFNKAIALAPNDPGGYVCSVQVLERMGRLDEAKEMLDKAVALDAHGELAAVTKVSGARLEFKHTFAAELEAVGWL